MTDNYILNHLLNWAKLFHGTDKKVFAYKKKGLYYFGNKKNVNIFTKPVAIFMVAGGLPKNKKK